MYATCIDWTERNGLDVNTTDTTLQPRRSIGSNALNASLQVIQKPLLKTPNVNEMRLKTSLATNTRYSAPSVAAFATPRFSGLAARPFATSKIKSAGAMKERFWNLAVALDSLLAHKGSAPDQHSDSEPVVPSKSNRVTPELADRNAAQIVSLRAWGLDSLAHCPSATLVYRKATKLQRLELARLKKRQQKEKEPLALALNADIVGKMRRIATDYDKEQIENLAEQIRRSKSRFSTSHLIRSLAVANRKTRDSLVAEAIRGSCTLSVLERRVQVARGARRVGAGRKPFVPTDQEQRLVVLEGLVLKWLRWTKLASSDLPSDVGKLVTVANTAVAAVQMGLAKHLPRTQKGEGEKAEKVKASRPTTSSR